METTGLKTVRDKYLDLSDLAEEEFVNLRGGQALCAVCQQVDFPSLTQEAGVIRPFPTNRYGCGTIECEDVYLKIGLLKNISLKQGCPGCRLILAALSTSALSSKIHGNTSVNLKRHFFRFCDERKPEVLDAKSESHHRLGVPAHAEAFVKVMVPRNDISDPSQQQLAAIIIRRSMLSETRDARVPVFSPELTFRPRGRQVDEVADVDLVKEWLQFCQSQHPRCREPAQEGLTDHQIRLIDVHNHMIVDASLDTEYLALSYVWGSNTMPILTRKEVGNCFRKGGLDRVTLPQTISDAMDLVCQLGKRYLWVDSVCIVQDDPDDKERQLPLMAKIYGHAFLVVVAASGSNANAGLPGMSISAQRQAFQQYETISGTDFITVSSSLQTTLQNTVWQKRGWTFQEAMRSRRALIFTENVVHWSCLAEIWREDIQMESSIYRIAVDHDADWPLEFSMDRQSTAARINCRTSNYRGIASNFSQRTFKEESDALWALNGILEHLSSRYQEGFLWGVPREDLDHFLLWSDPSNCGFTHHRTARHEISLAGDLVRIPFPSWSWLSVSGKVLFRDTCKNPIHAEITWPWQKEQTDDRSLTARESNPTSQPFKTDNGDCDACLPLVSGVVNYNQPIHCTAKTCTLLLRVRAGNSQTSSRDDHPKIITGDIPGPNREYLRDNGIKIHCDVLNPDGVEIGRIQVPMSFLKGGTERSGHFVLLSSNFGTVELWKHEDERVETRCPKCGPYESRNLMLVEAKDNITYRVALTEIGDALWRQIATEEKDLVLG